MKKLRKIFAMALVLIMAMSLMSVSVFAAEYDCGKEEHAHIDACKSMVVDSSKCIKEEHAHSEACNHVHTVDGGCYNLTCGTATDVCQLAECAETHEHTGACHIHANGGCTYHAHAVADGCYAQICTKSESDPDCGKEEHSHTDDCKSMVVDSSKCIKEEHAHSEACIVLNFAAMTEDASGTGWSWTVADKTLTLSGAVLTKTVTLPDGAKIVVDSDSSVVVDGANAIVGEGALAIEGTCKLTITGSNGIVAASVAISNIDLDVTGGTYGIYAGNSIGDATVGLSNVDGSITGGYAGIYVYGDKEESNASVIIDGCDLDVTSTAASYNGRAQKSGITVCAFAAEKVETSITITDSKVDAIGADAGLAINNYMNDADATNSASSRINITRSTVVAKGTNGTWAGIFASVLGQHPDADSIITITDSSVYAASSAIGVMTSSQKGESRIILDNSILGAGGKTALRIIEPTAQAQVAEIKNGSTYVQLTPEAINLGEIKIFDGKTIVATAGDGITYDTTNNYYIIPQGSAVTESFTDNTSKEYTFNNQAGGVGGFDYAKEEVWGFDVPEPPAGSVAMIQETGDYYETLTAAVADANKLTGANTIVVLKDIDFDSTKALAINDNLTIISEDGTNHVISRGDYTGTLFSIAKGKSLTLDGGIVIDGDNNWVMDMDLYNEHLETMAQQGISIYTAGMDRKTEIDPYNTEKASQYFTPEAGAPVANAYMITVGNNATLNLKNVTIQNNYTPKSGLVNTSAGAVVNLEGAQIKHCASIEGSGTVVNASGKITINVKSGTLLDGNHVGGNHGLFRVYSGAVVNMSGGTISNTTGWNSNGVVIGMYGTGSTFNMSGGLITGNSSVFGADNGRNAAVYLHANSTMNMTGGTISFNNGRARGGIDTYKDTSTLNINRADQVFVDGVYANENGKDAYIASNHPMIVDNYSRANNYNYDVGHSGGNYLGWWVTGGIYTQDVDEFCAEGYVCIPYEDTARTDDYIVVPGYRVSYYSVAEVEGTDAATGKPTKETVSTLLKKDFLLLPADKFWNEVDLYAKPQTLTNAEKTGMIDTWYTDETLSTKYDFSQEVLDNLHLYGEWKFVPTDDGNTDLTYTIILQWNDNDDAANARPKHVIVELFRNGQQGSKNVNVKDKDNWTAYETLDASYFWQANVKDTGNIKGYTFSVQQNGTQIVVTGTYETIVINDENVPMTGGDTIILDGDVPLADVPETGDPLTVMAAMSILSGAGVYFTRKKREDEE